MSFNLTIKSPVVAIGAVFLLIAIIITHWVGTVTVYDQASEAKRLVLHEAILNNEPPNGTSWKSAGASSTNIRFATVWLADVVQKATGLSINRVYKLIDLSCLFASLMVLILILRLWYESSIAFCGVLLFSCFLPLTMFFGYFHPWDRPSLLLWAAMIYFLCTGRMAAFVACYLLAVLVKFDSLTATALIPILGIGRNNFFKPLAIAGLVTAAGALLIALLIYVAPAGFEPTSTWQLFLKNLTVASSIGFFYPPLLTHGFFFGLGLLAWRGSDNLQRRLWIGGLVLLVPHALFTNFVEVRAQVASVICMLPLALRALENALNHLGPKKHPDVVAYKNPII